MEKWYRLGGSASSFWDPHQPVEENKFMHAMDVKKLKSTEKVKQWQARGGLVVVDEAEAQGILAENAKRQKEEQNEQAANSTLEKAAKKEQEAKIALKEANTKLKAAEKVQEKLDEVSEERDNLLNRNAELEELLKKAGAQQPQK